MNILTENIELFDKKAKKLQVARREADAARDAIRVSLEEQAGVKVGGIVEWISGGDSTRDVGRVTGFELDISGNLKVLGERLVPDPNADRRNVSIPLPSIKEALQADNPPNPDNYRPLAI